jgi:hypothetical protein
MGMPPTAAAKVVEAYKIPKEGVSPIFPLTHVECSSFPSRSEITCVGRRRPGESADGPIFTRGASIDAHWSCPPPASEWGCEARGSCDHGGQERSSHFPFLFPLIEGPRSRGCPPHPRPPFRCPTGGASRSLSLSQSLCSLIESML